MMNCNIAEDLLPLYLDDACSHDSRVLLEAHLDGCPACREKLKRMGENEVLVQLQARTEAVPIEKYAKKVKRHRFRMALLIVCAALAAAVVLALCALTVLDMRSRANPVLYTVEKGTYDLTAKELEASAETVGETVLYTNNERISVTVRQAGEFHGMVKLWDAECQDTFILISEVDQDTDSVVFEGLSASRRYIVTCDGLEGAAVTVSDGRIVSFWYSLGSVLSELFSLMFS